MIISGTVLVGIGLLVTFGPKLPFLRQIGHLPGDIVIHTPRFSFYFPIITCLLVSLLLSLLLLILRR